MSVEYDVTETLDVTGLNCPMPVVKTKQAIDDVETGGVLEVTATDPGSMSDVDGWAGSTAGVELLDQVETDEDGETVYKHFVRRTE
ncbi:MAG: sulfurtransferase TusA family protein [Halanaeroarchaeum sp.]